MAKNTRSGDRAYATVQRTGGNCPSKVSLLPSVVNGWRTGSVLSPVLRPAVRTHLVRAAISPSRPVILPRESGAAFAPSGWC